MKKTRKRRTIIGLGMLAGLLAGFGAAALWFPPFQAFRLVFGTFFVLFLPGLVMSFVFFPGAASLTRFEEGSETEHNEPPSLDWIERITLAFALSLSVVPLSIYATNRLGLAITSTSVFGLTLAIILVSLFSIFLNSRQRKS